MQLMLIRALVNQCAHLGNNFRSSVQSARDAS
jgi:hypothetical protein